MFTKRRIVISFGLMALLSACGVAPTPAPASANLNMFANVFAAASLTDAFNEVGKAFEAANPGAKIAFNYAGSQQLAQQIGQGAPADVFASANAAQMEAAIKTGRVVSGTAQTFARNRLVVITPKTGPNPITQLKDLAKPALKVVLADKAVPVGGYALDFLRKASATPDFGAAYSQTVLANVVSYEQDVKAVLSKVALGEADAGIVYATDVLGDSASKVNRIDIPDALNTVAVYPIAALNDSKNAALAQKFVAFVLAPEGQQILAKYGFTR